MGVRRIMAEAPPDLILSGVNRGQNIAEDVTYSGTVAAAMEGALLGIPSIALSQAYGGPEGRHAPRWETSRVHGAPLIKAILAAGIPAGGLVNVNFPPCPPAEVTGVGLVRQGRRSAELLRIEERRDGRGLPYYWLMFQRQSFTPPAGTDIAALLDNRISLTPLRLDLTDDETLRALREQVRAIVSALRRGSGRVRARSPTKRRSAWPPRPRPRSARSSR